MQNVITAKISCGEYHELMMKACVGFSRRYAKMNVVPKGII